MRYTLQRMNVEWRNKETVEVFRTVTRRIGRVRDRFDEGKRERNQKL